jgi:hypothetical protein
VAILAQGSTGAEYGERIFHRLETWWDAEAAPSGAIREVSGAGGTESRADSGSDRQPKRKKLWKRGACIDPIGYDAGKKIKGKKRHILVDMLGLLLHAIVHPANIQDRDGGVLVLVSLFGWPVSFAAEAVCWRWVSGTEISDGSEGDTTGTVDWDCEAIRCGEGIWGSSAEMDRWAYIGMAWALSPAG